MDQDHEDAVVVPLIPLDATPTTETMLRMLLSREALLIQPRSISSSGSRSGMIAPTSGAVAKAIGQAMGHAGRVATSDRLYRVVLPSGSVVRDLVPAVGGGFRGMVRAGTSTKVTGHVRLLPAAAGAGATIAAGPLIATVGLAVAGEMLAQHQINKKLDSIRSAVIGVQRHLDDQDRSVLTTADQEARKVAGYLLDQAQLPAFSAASTAFANLNQLTNRRIETLDRWLEVAETYSDADRVNASDLMNALVGKGEQQIQQFERAVAQTYEALALRARVVVLEKIASEHSTPTRSLPHVEQVLRGELAVLAERQGQLVGLLADLSAMQIDATKLPIAIAGSKTIGVRTSFGRMARALHSAPDGLPMLTETDGTVLDLAPGPDGLEVMTPVSPR